ncbi:hypothetical protein LOK49_LG03G03064 [Camellia lanceoleosa]|uniref:Uncharacterized protein n=1 Tax=Camellia lanceoleosa TaxID=1840588 RepID=A0ACC0I5K1_9ERIC|nr:hypothetical protein LOK49_LG03G03064 [Camellia lanceoleosa]
MGCSHFFFSLSSLILFMNQQILVFFFFFFVNLVLILVVDWFGKNEIPDKGDGERVCGKGMATEGKGCRKGISDTRGGLWERGCAMGEREEGVGE